MSDRKFSFLSRNFSNSENKKINNDPTESTTHSDDLAENASGDCQENFKDRIFQHDVSENAETKRPLDKKLILSFLYWVLPVAILALSPIVLKRDYLSFIMWYFSFFVLGILFLPLTSSIFSRNRDRGYSFSKSISLALPGFTLWTLSHFKILPFNKISIFIICIIFFALFMFFGKTRESFFDAWQNPATVRLMAVEETIFAGGMLFWSFARGLKPLLDSLEKPMDYGFMMSLMRTDFLPAKDMWYSQGSMNYYYFGQYIYTFVTKFSGLHPRVTYNLAMGTTFAFTLVLSFALGYMFIEFARRKGLRLFSFAPALGGVLTAIITTLGGNSHSFFYGSRYSSELGKNIRAPGYGILKFLQDKGILDKLLPPLAVMAGEEGATGNVIDNFWFANSTRYIGYNPTTPDKTIHEFPYYSFLVADLHAHLINLVFVLLFIALALVLSESKLWDKIGVLFSKADSYEEKDFLIRTREKSSPIHTRNAFRLSGLKNEDELSSYRIKNIAAVILKSAGFLLREPAFLLASLLLGIFMMCNFWDFAIYLVVFSMAALVGNLRGFRSFGSWGALPLFIFQVIFILVPFLFISNPFLAVAGFAVSVIFCHIVLYVRSGPFTITGAALSWIFFISHFLTLPFNASFDPMAKSLRLVPYNTPWFQLAMLWGAHILAGIVFTLFIIIHRIRKTDGVNPHAYSAKGPLSKFFLGMNAIDLFMAGIFVCGIIFVLLPEILYVVDIYTGHVRANTMFKFTYQAFVLLSLTMGYAITRICIAKPVVIKRPEKKKIHANIENIKNTENADNIKNTDNTDNTESDTPASSKKKGERVYIPYVSSIILVLLLTIPMYYPFISTTQWLGKFKLDNYKGLDGISGVSGVDIISTVYWFEDNVSGQPVILEAYGDSYTDSCQISAYTGLPTLMGWQTHEWLWRTSKTRNGYSDVVLPMQKIVDQIYLFDADKKSDVIKTLKDYSVEYVVIGPKEKEKYPEINENGLLSLGEIVYSNETVKVIKLDLD